MPRGAAYSQKKNTTFQTFSFQNKITKTATFAFVSHLFPKPPHPNQAIKPSTQHTHTHARARTHTHTHTHTHSSVYFLTPSALYFSSIYLFTGFEQDPANSWGLPHPGTKPEPFHRAQGGEGEPDVMATGLQNK